MKRITIKDVARVAETSVTTVSLILNGKGQRFSKETRDKVLFAQQKLGYIPNYYAQSLVGKPSTTIGVIVPDIGNPFFSAFVKGIEDVTFQHDIVPLIFDVGEDYNRANYYLQTLTHRTVDGVILASHSISQTVVDQILNKNGIPYVTTDQTYLYNDSDEVLVDDEMGGHLAIDYFVGSGHKSIAMVLPTLMTRNLIKRFTGYRKGLTDNGIAFDDRLVFRTEFSRYGGYNAAEQIVKSDATAIFSVNDDVAIGLYRGLKDLGKRIPEDYSIIGYDDIDWCQYVEPQLTTIHQPIYEMGVRSTVMLLNRIQNPSMGQQKYKFNVSLVVRASTKTLKQEE